MKPDWKDAPEWAQWLARDENGSWFWYATRPLVSGNRWITDTKYEHAGDSSSEWEKSREERP